MAKTSVIDKKIAELQAEIVTKQAAIEVLRSVQRAKPKPKPRAVPAVEKVGA